MNYHAVIVAGGSGTRMKSDLPKQFIELNQKPILVHTIEKFLAFHPAVNIILVLPSNHLSMWNDIQEKHLPEVTITVAKGGSTRTESVSAGISLLPENGFVAIHDAVRPFVDVEVINESFKSAERFGSGVAAVPLKDSIREIAANGISMTRDRANYMVIQTPQTFDIGKIRNAYEVKGDKNFTDDASVYENAGYEVRLIEGAYSNIKITTSEDLPA